MQRSVEAIAKPAAARRPKLRRAGSGGAQPTPGRRIGSARRGAPRQAVVRAVLGLAVLALAGLGSYDLEASKPRVPNLPVERICPQRFQIVKDGVVGQVPLCLSAGGLEVDGSAVSAAIVVVHGNSRNAVSAYDSVERVVREAGRRDTLVAAPHFLIPIDVSAHDLPLDAIFWRSAVWSQGDRSDAASSPMRISAFEVVDRLVTALADPGRYPNLREIAIAGHSAGGQFVQRYAAGTSVEQQPTLTGRGIAVRYVVANPSSYLYPFPRPPDRLTERCSRYDEYKYGLADLNAYLLPVGPDAIRAAYAQKDVTILIGGLDYQMVDPSKDDSCSAVVQGAHRQSRAARFLQHLDQHYGPAGHRTRLVRVAGVGHSAREMFGSAEGRAALLTP